MCSELEEIWSDENLKRMFESMTPEQCKEFLREQTRTSEAIEKFKNYKGPFTGRKFIESTFRFKNE